MNVTLTPEPFVDARRVAELLEIKRRDQCREMSCSGS
jgi:hypothetical protein